MIAASTIRLVLAAVFVFVAIAIFVAVCVYAAWETRIDRRRQQRLDDRAVWDELDDAWKQPWKNTARERELAG